jgi:hypothetical protein
MIAKTNNFIVGALYSDTEDHFISTILEFVKEGADTWYFKYVIGVKSYKENEDGLIGFEKGNTFYEIENILKEKTAIEKIYAELAERFKDEPNKNMILGYTMGVLEKNKKAIAEEYLELQKKIYGSN